MLVLLLLPIACVGIAEEHPAAEWADRVNAAEPANLKNAPFARRIAQASGILSLQTGRKGR